MELRKNKKKLIVAKSEIESKISSKKDLHYILRQGCKQLLFIKIGQYYFFLTWINDQSFILRIFWVGGRK